MTDCVKKCDLSADMMIRKSNFYKEVCALCAEICEKCAANCEEMEGEQMQKCAEICRECAKEYRRMN